MYMSFNCFLGDACLYESVKDHDDTKNGEV